MEYPWLQSAWQDLQQQQSRLHHALLFTGPRGIGKLALARHLAKTLLCESTANESWQPCGQCPGCRWFDAGNHPDFRTLTLDVKEEEGEESSGKTANYITIDQVRSLGDFVGLTAHRQGRKVILVEPAEALNTAAANALLKTLEEPPSETYFLLVSHAWRRLMPTIRSRCRQFPLPVPDRQAALQWLQQQQVANPDIELSASGGFPLQAKAQVDSGTHIEREWLIQSVLSPGKIDVLQLAQEAEKRKLPVADVTTWLQRLVADVISLNMAGNIRYYPDKRIQLETLARVADARKLSHYLDQLTDTRRLALHPLNQRMVYEQLFFGYQSLWRTASH